MKTCRLIHHPLPLALCLGIALAGLAVPSGAADAPARSLDWSQTQPKASAWSAPADSAGARLGAPAAAPAPGRAPQATASTSLDAKATSPAAEPALARSGASRAAKGLFALDDRAIIIVGGKSTTAGQVKRALQAEIAAKAGAPKTVRGGARKLDLTALLGPGPAGAKPLPNGGLGGLPPQGGTKTRTPTTKAATASALQSAQTVRPGVTQTVLSSKEAISLGSLRCPDKGPPKISESPGKLKVGGTAALSGQCFGDRPGKVELIGQFPGGKLTLPFMAWDNNAIELSIPMTIRGAADHVVAVTVVTAEGRTSTAMQAQFVAARERVEVPERLWSPSADFDFSATSATRALVGPEDVNEAHAGHASKTLRVQPQCALDTMDAVVTSGGISQIRGWEEGPPNEAAVTIDWVGTCVNTKTTTNYNYVVVQGSPDVITKSACRVAFQARAWAYCPAGIAP